MRISPARRSRNLSSRTPFNFCSQFIRSHFVLLLLVALACLPALAQKNNASSARQKLPAPDKIIGDYVKAVGGKKRLAAVRDATYQWTARGTEQTSVGTATTRLKSPSSARTDIKLGELEFSSGTTARSAWSLERDSIVRTLTGTESKAARLQTMLDAARLVDYKKHVLSAVTTGAEQVAGERAYVVEFRSRDGARLRYLFGATSKLLLQIVDEARRMRTTFGDYRAQDGLLEPHRIELELDGAPQPLTLALQSVRYNDNLSDSLFDAPSKESFDVKALLREVIEREPQTNVQYGEYTYTAKQTERELNDKGETKKETVYTWDIFLAPNGNGIGKLTSLNNQPLPAERAAKEEKRVADFLLANEKAGPPTRKGEGGFYIKLGNYGFGLTDILRASEFVAPRRERFQERESIVFDYRPRADFKPKSKSDVVLKNLVGLIWIDPVDKVVMRIEARSTDDFKVGGGLLLNVSRGAGFVFERMRLPDGFWVPRLFQWNANGKGFLIMKMSVYEVTEWSNFKRFKTESGEDKIDAPKQQP